MRVRRSVAWVMITVGVLALGIPTTGVDQPRGQLVAALDSDRETLDPHQATGTIDYMVLMQIIPGSNQRPPASIT